MANRFMVHLPTNTLHIYNERWLQEDNSGFFECDENKKVLNPAIEGEFTKETEPVKATKSSKKVPVGLEKSADDAIAEAIAEAETALRQDASRGL